MLWKVYTLIKVRAPAGILQWLSAIDSNIYAVFWQKSLDIMIVVI